MASLSVAVVALNEAERIRACLESVAWADQVVVVDSGSSDKTVEIAREFTDHVLFHPWAGFAAQKNFAATQCRGDWILSLDADERVTEALGREIAGVLAGDPPVSGFFVPRRNVFRGRWMRWGGLYPDYQLRLFRRGRGAYRVRAVHESLCVDGATARLRAPLLHESYRGVEDFVTRANRYSDLAARDLAAEGRGGSVVDLLFRPLWRFVRMYVVRGGFLDGWHGFLLAVLYAHYVFIRTAKVRELRVAGEAGEGSGVPKAAGPRPRDQMDKRP